MSPPVQRSVVMVLVSALAQLVFVVGTDEAELLTAWLPDDAFYCLQPAWAFGKGQGFTFDGLTATYGFQPLWTLILGSLATVLGSKSQLLVASLLLGGVAHLTTGALLFACLQRWGHPDAGVLAAALWLLNPDLVRLQATGLESGLVGVLLMLILLAAPPRISGTSEPPSARRALLLGGLCGLMFLARVSLGPVAVIVGGWLWLRSRRNGLLFGLGCLAVAVPWLVWADHALGQALPLSGDRKLIGGPAGLARFAATFPGVTPAFAQSLLGPREALLFHSQQFATPSWERLWTLGPRATAGWAFGHWLPSSLRGADLLRAGGLLGVGVTAVAGWRLRAGRVPVQVWVLMAVGSGHALAHHLLLSSYVEYSYWYRVPELLTGVLLVALLLAPARRVRGPLLRAGAAALVVVGGLGGGDFLLKMQPRPFDQGADRVSVGVLSVARSMSERLPAGTQVGAWNAGLLGWAANGPVVRNLDGLANSVAFGPVAEAEILFRHGVGTRNPTLDWLHESDVRYLVDLHPIDGLGTTPFYDLIPPEHYRPILRSPPVTRWGQARRDHAVALVGLVPRPPGAPTSPAGSGPPRSTLPPPHR